MQYDDEYIDTNSLEEQMQEEIRQAKIRRQRADQLAKDRLHAEIIMIAAAVVIVVLIILLIIRTGSKKQKQQEFLNSTVAQSAQLSDEDKTDNDTTVTGKTVPEYKDDKQDKNESPYKGQAEGHSIVTENGITYVDGILIVNKTFSLPSDYDPGLDGTAKSAFDEMAGAAWGDGISLWICSGYRNYAEQEQLFDGYATQRGLAEADEVSARPGHSEHQSGLCMDVNSTDFEFASTAEAQWLAENCADYGFIIRFPQGKEDITGYSYEPWHIRYVGKDAALAMKASGQCLEEYLGVTSDYADSLENEDFIKKYSSYGNGQSSDGQTNDGQTTEDQQAAETQITEQSGTGEYQYQYDGGQDGGYSDGYSDGYTDGYTEDYNGEYYDGYSDGYSDGYYYDGGDVYSDRTYY